MDAVGIDFACIQNMARCDAHFAIALLFLVMCGRTRCTEVMGRNEDARAELARFQDAKNAADQEVNHRSNKLIEGATVGDFGRSYVPSRCAPIAWGSFEQSACLRIISTRQKFSAGQFMVPRW